MNPLVQIADIDRVVMMVTTVESKMILVISRMPAWPTHQGIRKKIMTPQMFRRHLASTPLTQSNFSGSDVGGIELTILSLMSTLESEKHHFLLLSLN